MRKKIDSSATHATRNRILNPEFSRFRELCAGQEKFLRQTSPKRLQQRLRQIHGEIVLGKKGPFREFCAKDPAMKAEGITWLTAQYRYFDKKLPPGLEKASQKNAVAVGTGDSFRSSGLYRIDPELQDRLSGARSGTLKDIGSIRSIDDGDRMFDSLVFELSPFALSVKAALDRMLPIDDDIDALKRRFPDLDLVEFMFGKKEPKPFPDDWFPKTPRDIEPINPPEAKE